MYHLKYLLKNIEYVCDSQLPDNIEVKSISSDSKNVPPGCLFVCLKGTRRDSHDYITEVIRRGASVIICDINCAFETDLAIMIRVENTHQAYARILSEANGSPEKRLKLIGVTGTNGKTTVTHMIHSALCSLGKKAALIGTLGAYFDNEYTSIGTMTTPDPELLYPLLSHYADLGAEYAVMEVSSHALALCKADGLHFKVAAITNITPEHLDFHGNMDEYTSAKSKLFSMCDIGVFCTDDPYTSRLAASARCSSCLTCSASGKRADNFAADIKLDGINGCSFTVRHSDGGTRISSKIPGMFTVSNALLAFSVLTALGFSNAEAAKGSASLSGVKGRMEVLDTKTDFTVIIDFAHTPDALSKLLQSVRTMRKEGQRIVTLFGCGGDRDKSKRSLMGAIASQLSDFVIITSDNSRSESIDTIIDQILSSFNNDCPHICINDRSEAISYAIENALPSDIILLCGKGHEEYEINSNGKHPFSERDTVFSAIKKFKKGEKK